jgi:serine/threonine-protein kinase RsbW
MAKIPHVCLTLANRPENVLVVRQALTGVADGLGLDAIEANDLSTAVTEACNNVVLHAYGEAQGPLEVDVYALLGAVGVVVRDRGNGFEPCGREGEKVQGGIGLAVIRALSHHAELKSLAEGGTEVSMKFPAAKTTGLGPLQGDGPSPWSPAHIELADTVQLSLAPSTLARKVLPRVLSALAARVHFSTDRIADVQLVADALAANSDESVSGSHLDVGVTLAPRNLELRIGPLHPGRGESLIAAAADGLAPVIERLTDGSHAVVRGDSAETLALRLVQR